MSESSRIADGRLRGGSLWVSGLLIGLTLLSASPADGQLRVGGHLVSAQDAFSGTLGVGVRAGIDSPLLPFEIVASGEYFFADRPPEESGCGLYGLTADANFRIVFPVVRPYVSAGFAYRNIDPAADNQDQSVVGPALGVGLDVGLSGIRIFGESRCEFVDAPEKQFVWRLGAMFEVF